MDKRIIIGIVAGILFGLLGTFVLEQGGFNATYLIIVAVLGGLIGFAGTQTLPLNYYLMSAIIGAIFYAVIAVVLQGSYVDQIITGAVAGALIALITTFLHKQLNKG